MSPRRRETPFYHARALACWLCAVAARNPRAVQWLATGLLSLLIGGGTAVGIARTDKGQVSTLDRQWLVDSFPAHLRPTIRNVVQEETLPMSAKLDTMEEKNLEVRRFIVSTSEYRRWKLARERRRMEEERLESEAERGFSFSRRGADGETRAGDRKEP
jgi:hypothetical protein